MQSSVRAGEKEVMISKKAGIVPHPLHGENSRNHISKHLFHFTVEIQGNFFPISFPQISKLSN